MLASRVDVLVEDAVRVNDAFRSVVHCGVGGTVSLGKQIHRITITTM